MALIKQKDIDELLAAEDGLCISIFIPTHRAGAEVLNNQDSTLFKNKIRDARTLLAKHEVPVAEIEQLLKPAEDLLNDQNFWRHQSEGLAVYITRNFMKTFTLPIPVIDNVYVLDHFYFTPILPMLSRNGRFFILWLNRDKVMFYEATVERIRPIDISGFVADSINKALKFDVRSHDQDFHHSTTTVNGSNIVHGPGSQKGDEEHDRVHEFMAEVDAGLQKILHNAHEPLVLAGVEHYCSIFRSKSKYKNIVQQCISVNEGTDAGMNDRLHEKALEIIKPIMHQDHSDMLDRYQNVVGTGRASDDIVQIATEAIHGRVDTLFITPSEPVWGTYDKASATAVIHDEYQRGDNDLVNLAAVKTLAQGGKVYVNMYAGMAEAADGSPVKALFRY